MSEPPVRGTPSSLIHAQSQLEIYARELQQVVAQERESEAQVRAARSQLESFAADFRKVLDEERQERARLELSHEKLAWTLACAAASRAGHDPRSCERVAAFARLLARELGLAEREAEVIGWAAGVRDLGMIGVPEEIPRRRGRIEGPELRALRAHVEIGARLIESGDTPRLATARVVALSHHECFDGNGYPKRLAGDVIPLAARIAKLADVYEALRSPRPFRPALSHERVRRGLLEGAGDLDPASFDPALLEVFERQHAAFEAVFEEGSRRGG